MEKAKTVAGLRPAAEIEAAHRPGRAKAGDVVCRLDAVLLVARRQFGLDIESLAEVTHIDARVLRDLSLDLKQQYDLSVFARLCWVLDTQVGTFLMHLPPAQIAAERSSAADLGQIALPALSLRTPLPENAGAVRCQLKQVLASRRQDYLAQLRKPGKQHVSYPDLESLLGVKAQRLADWANNVPARYDRLKMAELCHALQLGVGDLWRYEPPASTGE